MYRLHPYRTRIETVNAGQHFLNFQVSAIREDDLLPQRILLVVVESEISGESFVDEGVVVLEDDFNAVPAPVLQQLSGNAYLVVQKVNVSRIQSLSVHH